ncbi:uncharacterized protein FSUBG_6830 [Fusarium subglutinans]|uniref:Uncharacterized protein n=1 Tax=Gibberella subglutinans TaxID=42677 RepID=A0A8H5PWX9_GIBSU|nr:uncharacterized protein FSUBG_6830 [Fusarium subglutinans]KAF5604527.1 hypothetical protein FSUBG_6830 [Fusarium subglutinans]
MNPQPADFRFNCIWGGEIISQDELLRRLGPEGCKDWVERGQGLINQFGPHAAKSPAGTAHENIQQRGNAKVEKTPRTKSSQDMDNIRKIRRLMERVEVLEDKNRSLKRKKTEFEYKQAKMVKLLTDE